MQRIRHGIRDQRGFTLIEIIMVIVLLGIIAAIAIPKYVDLKSDAADASADGIIGAIVASAAIGYADRVVNETGTYPNITTLDTSYLSVQQVTLTLASGTQWTSTIGGTLYTFTYTDSGTNAGSAGR
jgi:prepilin-type N-terminal cleavage/methylation domain-containing protein